MASFGKKRSISVKKLIKFCCIMLVCIYASFILVKQQMTLSTIEDAQAERSAAISNLNTEHQSLEDELKKAESVSSYINSTIAEKEDKQNKDKKADDTKELASAEDEYIEQLIRDRLGYVKPNERIFVDISRNN